MHRVTVAATLALAAAARADTGDTANAADTGDTANAADTAADTASTDTAATDTGLFCSDAGVAAGLVINELMADPAGADNERDWLELFNRGEEGLDLSGWSLHTGDAAYERNYALPGGLFLGARDYLVIGGELATQAQLTVGGLIIDNGVSGDAIQLRDCAGAVVDTVVFGPDNADGWLDDTGAVASSIAPIPQVARTIGRLPDGTDTDQSGLDFAHTDEPTPGNSNQLSPLYCGGPGSGVVINEIFRGSGSAEAWIEVLHTGLFSVDLTGWSLQIGRTEWTTAYSFVTAENLLPGGRLLIGSPSVPEVGYPAALTLGDGTRGDVVRIVDCNGFAADTVVYGPENKDGWPDDSALAATSLAPEIVGNLSLARIPDGADTDLSAADLLLTTRPTPGHINVLSDDTGTPPSSVDTGRKETSECGCDSGSPLPWWELALAPLRRRR